MRTTEERGDCGDLILSIMLKLSSPKKEGKNSASTAAMARDIRKVPAQVMSRSGVPAPILSPTPFHPIRASSHGNQHRGG